MTRDAGPFPPVGERGSGMARYAAAMALYQRHAIGDATLEVFRICAPDDRLDPLSELKRLRVTADIPLLEQLIPRENAS
jgi:hypothetical protein